MQTYESPPAGFDPQTAEARLLRRHGFPRRPDPANEPHLMRLWQRAFARAPRLQMVKAELETDAIMSGRRTKLEFGPNGQAGVVVPPSRSESVNMVFAEWVIPQIFPLSDKSFGLVSFWIGISGILPSGGASLLQAGVMAITGTSTTDPAYHAWTEWYTTKYKTPALKVMNFPVKAGDLLSVMVCAPEPNNGFVSMLNQTTQLATSVGVPAPGPDITALGQAQWTVEQGSPELPEWVPMAFTNCSGNFIPSNLGFNLSAPGAGAENITDSSGNALTSASIHSATSAFVLWEASM